MPTTGDDTGTGARPRTGGEVVAKRYRIVRWLGSGGMGRVYEAEDIELGEIIALKVLRAGLSDEALERFRREVKLTRRIQHANVARMFDIGEHAGDRFLTMELIDGEPLTRLLGAPRLDARLVRLARQLCAGLIAAHERGVIHRDLKPDNVLIERDTDRAVITDFGIARSIDDASVTQVGAIMGTPRYMSPEQLNAQPVDERTDIFSLGVILYELVTGERPWSGDNAISVAVSQATRAARPIMTTSIPQELADLIGRCLELEVDRRPASAREVDEALAAIARLPDDAVTLARPAPTAMTIHEGADPAFAATAPTTHAPVRTPSAHRHPTTTLAVLPLRCAPDDEYLADGVLEDLIDTLSATAGIRVRPAGVVRTHADPDPRALGRELEVEHVVVGSVRRTPAGALRLAARLIGVHDGFQIWAHRAEGPDADVLQLSEQVARGIAEALSTRATPPTRPTDPRAVDLYLRAKAELRLFWGNHVQAAADLLDQASEISPGSAPIAGARAFATMQAWVMSGEPRHAPRAREALARGLALDHPEALLASAVHRLNTGDPAGGAADLGAVLVRAPMLGQAHEASARLLVEVDALSEARHHFEVACSLDPARAHLAQCDLARLDALEGHWDTASASLATLIGDPDQAISQLGSISRARLALWQADHAAMSLHAPRFTQRIATFGGNLINFMRGVLESGTLDVGVWRNFLAGATLVDLEHERPRRSPLMGLQLLSEIAMLVDERDLAFEALARADEAGLLDVVVLDKCPLFAPVATTPAFRDIRERVRARAAHVLAAFRSTAG